MYTVSNNYKTQINKSVRNISYLKVNFGIVEADASNNNTMSDNGHLFYSDLNNVDTGQNIEKRYLTFERNKFILDGKNLLPQEIGTTTAYYQGFVSEEMSDAIGVFTVPPTITINFTTQYAFLGLTLRFNKIFNSYPSELQIIGYNGGVENYNSIIYPTGYDFVHTDPVPTSGLFCDKLEIKFLKTAIPYRRAELSYIMFGIVATFTDAEIVDSTWTRNIDLLSASLPQNKFEFTIVDPDKNYNPENPTGIWQYLEDRQPVWFQYGYELDDGTIEWLDGSNLYSNGEIRVDSESNLPTVTFTAESSLNALVDIYYRGKYHPSGISLYDLALDVLDFANIPLLQGGITPYDLDTALQSIYTTVPMPELPIKECLQLIANAGRCVINCDRVGKISIKRIDPDVSDFKFDFSNIMSAPVLDKSPFLRDVETFVNGVSVANDIVEIHKSSVSFGTETECRFTYEPSTEQTISVSGTLTIIGTPIYYAGSCIVTVVGTGDVSITGKKLSYIKNSIIYNYGINGYNCPIQNVLLNTEADTIAYAEWIASIIARRNEYKVNDRGYPELDVGDLVLTDTMFSTSLQATIIGNKIKYNGGLSGETTLLGKDVS